VTGGSLGGKEPKGEEVGGTLKSAEHDHPQKNEQPPKERFPVGGVGVVTLKGRGGDRKAGGIKQGKRPPKEENLGHQKANAGDGEGNRKIMREKDGRSLSKP